MKNQLLLVIFLAFHGSLYAGCVVRDAIMKLPPEAVGDVPLNQRQILLDSFKEDAPRRLDEKNECVSFYTDGPEPFTCTSAFDIKVFHISGGGNIAFCCRTNPHGRTPTHVRGQTFIFKQHDGKWTDVTSKYLPPGISSEFFFTPRRKENIIEGEDINIKQRNGSASRQFDLVWNGHLFKIRKSPSSQYDYDFM